MLENHFAEWSERTGVAVEVWALPTRDLSAPVVRNVYATVREALTNVERHSGARTVSIALTVGREGLRLTVSDDGRGFPAETTGRGLVAMKAYFAEIGGTLTINSVLGEGTTISGAVSSAALAR
jgi:signal transduction histidine kinase